MLIRILRRFDPENRRLAVDNLLSNNNSNILVVNNETVRLSEEQSAFLGQVSAQTSPLYKVTMLSRSGVSDPGECPLKEAGTVIGVLIRRNATTG